MAAKRSWYMGVQTVFHITKDTLPGGPIPRLQKNQLCCQKCTMWMESQKQYLVDDMEYDDYQNLREHSQQESGSRYDWDYPRLRLNQGEPLPGSKRTIRNRVATSPTPIFWNLMCKQLLGFLTFMLFHVLGWEELPTYQPVKPKLCPCTNLHLELRG